MAWLHVGPFLATILCLATGLLCSCKKPAPQQQDAPPKDSAQKMPAARGLPQSSGQPKGEPDKAHRGELQALLGQIREGNSQIAEAAIQSIFAGGDPVECRAVADYFQNLPPEIWRNEIAAALRRSMGRDASLALVVSAIESKDEEWKSIVREALLMHTDADVLQQLVDRFDATPDNAGREFLVGTVEQVQKSEAIDPLMHLAEGLRTTGLEEDAMAWAAVRALAKIGTAPATLALYSLMDRTEDPTTRGALGTTLSTITSPEAIPALQAAAHGGKDAQRPETRVAAVYALSRQDREAAGVALQELSTVQDKDINEAARTALLAFEKNQIVRRTK